MCGDLFPRRKFAPPDRLLLWCIIATWYANIVSFKIIDQKQKFCLPNFIFLFALFFLAHLKVMKIPWTQSQRREKKNDNASALGRRPYVPTNVYNACPKCFSCSVYFGSSQKCSFSKLLFLLWWLLSTFDRRSTLFSFRIDVSQSEDGKLLLLSYCNMRTAARYVCMTSHTHNSFLKWTTNLTSWTDRLNNFLRKYVCVLCACGLVLIPQFEMLQKSRGKDCDYKYGRVS